MESHSIGKDNKYTFVKSYKNESYTFASDHYDVVISGAGPGGLADALEAINAGEKVCLINNREKNKFTRPQRVFLSRENRAYLASMINPLKEQVSDEDKDKDKEFIKQLNKPFIPIQDIESFIYHRILARKDAKIDIYHESMLSDIYLQDGQATIAKVIDTTEAKKIPISFDMMIGADGARHPSLDLVNENLLPKQSVPHLPDFTLGLHKYHIGCITELESESIAEQFKGTETQLIDLGLKDNLLYAMYFTKEGKDEYKCGVSCEIPKPLWNNYYETKGAYFNTVTKGKKGSEIAEAKNAYIIAARAIQKHIENLVASQAAKVAKSESPIKDVKLHFDYDDGIPVFTAFKTEISQAKKSYILVPGADDKFKVYLLTGDAFRTPYYPLAHGINNALDLARKKRMIFKCDPKDYKQLKQVLEKYDKLCKQNAKDIKPIILIGSLPLFKSLVWDKSVNVTKELTGELNLYRKLSPEAHRVVSATKGVKYEKLEELLKTNWLFVVDSRGNNVLHVANSEVFLWLRDKDRETFLYLCAQYNQSDESPIKVLARNSSVEELKEIFTPVLPRVVDAQGNNFAHQLVLTTIKNDKLFEIFNWLYKVNSTIFIEPNKDGLTVVDVFGQAYQKINVYNAEFKEQYAEILTRLKDFLKLYPGEVNKIDNMYLAPEKPALRHL